MRLYKNGELDGVSTNGLGKTLRYHTQFTAKLGEWGPNTRPNSRWRGLIDEPMIFNRALNSNEISAVIAAGTAGFCRPAAGSTNPPPVQRPDLVINSVSAPPTALMGQSVQLVYTTGNNGNITAFGPWLNEIRISTNTAGAGSQAVGNVPFVSELSQGASQTVTQSVILPAGVSGARFLGVTADALGAITESNETNNTAFASVAITINAADLVAGNANAPASAQFGQDITVTYAVTNRGNASATATGTDEIFLSPFSNSLSDATFLVSVPGAVLSPGAGYTRTQTVELPLITGAPAGTYYVIVLADAGNAQAEANEDNNDAAAPISLTYPPLPDLLVRSVLAPASVSPGTTATLTWTTTNQGPLTVTGGWSEVISISNSVFGAQSLAEIQHTNNLPPGGQVTRTESVPLPGTLAAGEWRFFVRTDSRFDVIESNEGNNFTVAGNASQVQAKLTLTLPVSELPEGAAPVLATLTRNGDHTPPLTVTITNSDPSELQVTNSVVIPAGQISVTFAVAPRTDGVVDGPQVASVGVTAPGYQGASANLTVLDVDVPRLTMLLGAATVVEGLTVSVTISRDYATHQPVPVVLNVDPRQFLVPVPLIIPSNQLGYTFLMLAVDDTLIEPSRTILVEATAAGFQTASGSVEVIDNDLPAVSLAIAAESVSEGAGPQAASATLTRSPASARTLTVELTSSDTNSAVVPATMTIPANQTSISFPIAAVDNSAVDGPRTVTIRVRVRDSFGNLIAQGTPDTLQILDDDGPTLKLTIARDLVAEGVSPATTATITRNTATNAALLVGLLSSDTTELTVPVSVTIPTGATSISFNLVSLLDGTTDGNQTVTVTASAGGFTAGSDIVVVTDIDLPDFVIVDLMAPTNGLTDGNFTISYRVENRGIAASTTPFVTRILLSTDTFLGDDTVLGEYSFASTLPVGLFIEQTSQFRLPTAPGRYWVIIVADVAGEIVEGLENNNASVTALPIQVSAAYTATVETPITTALVETVVPMSGSAVRANTGLPAANVPVNVHLLLRGTRRLLAAETDANGNFTTTFTPLPGEGGAYEIGAAHPGATTAPVQDTFSLFGLKLEATPTILRVTEAGSITGAVTVLNLGETTLAGLTASVVSGPPNLNVTLILTNTSLGALSSNRLGFVITANDASSPFGEVLIRVTSPSGASAETTLRVEIESLQPRLVATPESLYAAMLRGSQKVVEFDVANLGGAATGPLTVSIPGVSWLRVGSTNPLPSLLPGATSRVTLLLTPEPNLALGPYSGSISLSSGNARLDLPFEFRAVADTKGDLVVIAEDEFTYFAVGAPKVANATVTIRDPFTHQTLTNGVTDAEGRAVFPQLTEGHYEIEVEAVKHSPFTGTLFLNGGQTNLFTGFLSRETVQYRWTVVPTEIEDHTRIVVETEFETFVPIPVVTIDPPLIDLAGFTGSETQINLTIRNHGLITAQEFKLNFPAHPELTFTPLVTDLGAIPAQTTRVVPLLIKRNGATNLLARTSVGPCSVSVQGAFYYTCGPHTLYRFVGVYVENIYLDCNEPTIPTPGCYHCPIRLVGPSDPGDGGRWYTPHTQPCYTCEPLSFTPPRVFEWGGGCADEGGGGAAESGAGVCARVRLQLNQEAVLTRNAFNATLELGNSAPGSSLTNISVTLFMVDENGQPADERFGFRPPVVTGLGAVDGTGHLSGGSTGTVSYIIVPTSAAAPEQPTRYGVGGVLSYKLDGQEITVPLFPAPITVYPDPRLSVKYFHQRDVFSDDPFTRDLVEPTVPFSLAVMVQNRGGAPRETSGSFLVSRKSSKTRRGC